MRFLFFIALFSIGLAISAQTPLPKISIDSFILRPQTLRGEAIVAFNGYSTQGVFFNEKSLKNKITFINFWFEACAPCIAEIGALNKLYDDHKSNKDFQFLSFTYENPGKISQVIEKYNIQYPIISISHDSCYRLNFNSGFPTSIISNHDGKVAFYNCGGPTNPRIAGEKMVKDVYPVLKNLLENKQ